jgi:DNA processing protein
LEIPGVGKLLAGRISDKTFVLSAKREVEFIRNKGIRCLFYGEDDYPQRLLECCDAPMVLYNLGRAGLNGHRIISIVGTRRPGTYGLDLCRSLVADLASMDRGTVIVSGLAYGIDHCAHKSALDNGLETLAVLGHGLKYMYPALHRQMAAKITDHGALLTDFSSNQKPERNNFIRRNRIIAGLSDATIVVQSGLKGGALITADIADSYHRDVFAFPGRVGEMASEGCNSLIKNHKAAMIEGAEDLAYLLGWDSGSTVRAENHAAGFNQLSEMEKDIIGHLRSAGHTKLDDLSVKCHIPVSRMAEALLKLELEGMVSCLPGDVYAARI